MYTLQRVQGGNGFIVLQNWIQTLEVISKVISDQTFPEKYLNVTDVSNFLTTDSKTSSRIAVSYQIHERWTRTAHTSLSLSLKDSQHALVLGFAMGFTKREV